MLQLSNLYWRYVLWYEPFLTIFSLRTQQIEARYIAIKSAFFRRKPIPPFFFATLAFQIKARTIKLSQKDIYILFPYLRFTGTFSVISIETTFLRCIINSQLFSKTFFKNIEIFIKELKIWKLCLINDTATSAEYNCLDVGSLVVGWPVLEQLAVGSGSADGQIMYNRSYSFTSFSGEKGKDKKISSLNL